MHFITLNKEQNNSSECSICHFRPFATIFHFKLGSFRYWGAQEYFLPQGAGYPSYATEASKFEI